eukprot:jgi/Botrbrau1/15170/Bobra.0149s0035.1
MRIMIKGGVWKNTEDEILKAAVMKYGLNQWARISSLLVRKSAKQCKARWYEWLDPSIKKTEWTREEDEKLLHLAKLMPTQWRSIAPIVGRTPAQCIERYEKLLDAAAAKDDAYDPADDPRRLRPGEIDPNPEAKPARPDPIDMDEDEKEMLSEARARLANTRGKKAKRKAREKAMEEARRLATLQKKRELKAAGIELREKSFRRRGINYNKEVAFEKKPTIGFYDTAAEQERTKEVGKDFKPVTLEEMEGKRRKDIEAALMKRDEEKLQERQKMNQPAAVAKALELNDVATMRRRGKMMLPAPQVSEAELEAIARGGSEADVDPDLVEGAGGDATRRLLGDYQTPRGVQGPIRTPRIAGPQGQDRIMQEAANLAKMVAAQTPLAGGENPDVSTTDFSAITPRAPIASTPNPLAASLTPARPGGVGATPALGMTPLMGGSRAIAGVGMTPSVAGTPLRHPGATPAHGAQGFGATPMRTPIRDELGLNDPDVLAKQAEATRREARLHEAAVRQDVRMGLSGLPAPKNEYQIMVPENFIEDEPMEEVIEEDAADIAERKRAEAKAREEAELSKRSQVLQRGLPRPTGLAGLLELQPIQQPGANVTREGVEALLQAEVLALIQHEATRYPLKDKKKSKKRSRQESDGSGDNAWQEFEVEELAHASKLLKDEVAFVRKAMGHDKVSEQEYLTFWESAMKDFIWLPSKKRYERNASATNTERLQSIQDDHESIRTEMGKEAGRAKKLEDKINILLKGYQLRSAKLGKQLLDLNEEVEEAARESRSFQALKDQEESVVFQRFDELNARVESQQQREKEMQLRYKTLMDEEYYLKKELTESG